MDNSVGVQFQSPGSPALRRTLGNRINITQTPTGVSQRYRNEQPNHVEPRRGSDDDERPMTQRALRDAGLWNATPSA